MRPVARVPNPLQDVMPHLRAVYAFLMAFGDLPTSMDAYTLFLNALVRETDGYEILAHVHDDDFPAN